MGGRAADRRFESEGVQSSDPGGGDRELARGSRQCRRCRGSAKEEDAVVDLVGWAKRSVPTMQRHAGERWRARFALPPTALPLISNSLAHSLDRHCEERSDEAIHVAPSAEKHRLLRFARNDGIENLTRTKTSRGATRPRIC